MWCWWCREEEDIIIKKGIQKIGAQSSRMPYFEAGLRSRERRREKMHAKLAGAEARRRFAAHIFFYFVVVTFLDFTSFRAFFHRQISSTAFRRHQLQRLCSV